MLEAHNKTVQVLGNDAGGIMTDTFFVDTSGEFVVSKAQSMPQDESQALLQSAAQYYRLTPKKDPLKQIMQSYFPLQEEKDDRIYGAIDGALRANMFRQTQPRWLEWQKLFLSIIPFPEISAARAMPVLSTVVPNPEIQNGLDLGGARGRETAGEEILLC